MEQRDDQTALVAAAEVVAQQQRWVALMMGVHARLGAHSLVGRVPVHVWEQLCVDAIGLVNLEVDVEDEHGNHMQRLTAYSALKEAQLIHVLEPVFESAGLNLSEFTLATGQGRLKRLGTVKHECCKHDSADPINVRARRDVRGSEDTLEIVVKDIGGDGDWIVFKVKRRTVMDKVHKAFCAHHRSKTSQTRFVFGGLKVCGHHTAKSLDMEHKDVIDAIIDHVSH
eukprot:2713377-Rhodomonas_salina.2